ncbi:MAG: chromosomal replication initiator protein DnaA [Candidatus Moranbacteria bacterium]|nr:chromosomal replication initiator protein DnaA [Candidatus Moranbacteria bacterium]
MEHQELWKSVLGQIELSISKANFVTWFQNTAIVSIEKNTAIISVPNGFAKEWLENKYNHTIIQSLRGFDEQIRSIKCIISGPQPMTKKSFDAVVQPIKATSSQITSSETLEHRTRSASISNGFHSQSPKQATALFHESNLNSRYTFDDYIVAENNELANAACVAVSRNLGQIYNPLFIYGGVGLGKTHLLQALGNEVKRIHPEKNIKYITSERFTSELVDSIKNQRTDKFKEYYQQMDLLIIDDVQFLSGREKTQNEFFHIFNSLYQINKQIVISSDRPPKAIPTLEDRLRSRFEGGMITDISQPNEETRLAILRKKVSEKGLSIDEDALRFIAENITQNIREIEGALNRVIAYSEFYKTAPTISLVEKVLSQLIIQNKKTIQPKNIITAIEQLYSVSEQDLLKKGRKKGISNARQVAMYLMRTELNMPFSSIGDFFGGRDHTTALHAFEKINRELETNLRMKGDLSSLKSTLYQPQSE